ncbi:hypothetical protein [Streptomyces sp. NPDC060366]|uniref:hypothetical protein n=1 Tax=Streptomyces sp. NPDC060366 TaxID=3347105 RepID=UPI0036651849
MTRKRVKAPLFETGCVPSPGGPTPMRSHHSEPVHKACAEDWITRNATEARLGRFASDVQPKSRNGAGDHA